MCKRFRQGTIKFYEGGAVNAKTNAGFGGIAKAINEYFGVKVEELSFTQINAYILEIAKEKKEQLKASKGPETGVDSKTKLQDLKKLGIKINKRKRA